jgi:hypothetical protein
MSTRTDPSRQAEPREPGRRRRERRQEAGRTPERLDAEYVLPLRWSEYHTGHVLELTDYLVEIAPIVDVTVVDGSPDDIFAAHRKVWGDLLRHVKPDGETTGNGKVAGVLTGLRLARHNAVILADDDVRYDEPGLKRMVTELQDADLVLPQNYFTALPWHARWDTARSLINRAVASDYPGTMGVKRDLVLELGGYDGDVLFENLELMRTIRAAHGRERRADDLFVGRVPPSTAHFGRQRARQAYDDFAQPARLGLELSLLPLLVWNIRRPVRLAGIAALASVLAEVGRRRGGGTRVFPATSALWAPAWLLERAVCVWVAVGSRMLGGAKYRGVRLRTAAHSVPAIRRRLTWPRD